MNKDQDTAMVCDGKIFRKNFSYLLCSGSEKSFSKSQNLKNDSEKLHYLTLNPKKLKNIVSFHISFNSFISFWTSVPSRSGSYKIASVMMQFRAGFVIISYRLFSKNGTNDFHEAWLRVRH